MNLTSVSISVALGQIVADIYEAQGLAFVEATATFLTNDLLPLVEKTVTDTKVRAWKQVLGASVVKDWVQFT